MEKFDFIKKAQKVHGNKYDYSKVEYIDSHTKVCIICPIHGEFWQIPNNHLKGCGCPKCKGERIKKQKSFTLETFIERAKQIHGDKYDYSKVEYINSNIKVCIICPIHGEFWQNPNSHLKGIGCAECSGKCKLTTEKFIEKARKIHGNKYDYSKVKYVNNSTKICIICPIHGEFWQTPNKHLTRKHGCPKCGGSTKLTTEEFIERAKQIHGDKYDYSKVVYVNKQTKVCIICPKHGEFYMRPHDHVYGVQGCPHCKQSKLEKEIYDFLKNHNVDFIFQFRYDTFNLKNSVDFFIPSKNIVIECQGEQHFKPVDFANNGEKWANDLFVKNQQSDEYKNKLCKNLNYKIYYYTKKEYVENIKLNKIYNTDNICFCIDEINDIILK